MRMLPAEGDVRELLTVRSEIESTLRTPVVCPAETLDSLHTIRLFLRDVSDASEKCGVGPDAVFQALLTQVAQAATLDGQSGSGNVPMHQAKVLDRSCRPVCLDKDRVKDTKWVLKQVSENLPSLTESLTKLRELLRIKVEDAADIAMATAFCDRAGALQRALRRMPGGVNAGWAALSAGPGPAQARPVAAPSGEAAGDVCSPSWAGPVTQEDVTVLGDISAPFPIRRAALHRLRHSACTSPDTLLQVASAAELCPALCAQVSDRRSQIAKAACDCAPTVAEALPVADWAALSSRVAAALVGAQGRGGMVAATAKSALQRLAAGGQRLLPSGAASALRAVCADGGKPPPQRAAAAEVLALWVVRGGGGELLPQLEEAGVACTECRTVAVRRAGRLLKRAAMEVRGADAEAAAAVCVDSDYHSWLAAMERQPPKEQVVSPPQPEMTPPPQPEMTPSPQPEAVAPRPEVAAPRPEMAAPRPERPEMAAPPGVGTRPSRDATPPQPREQKLSPPVLAPELFTSKPLTPKPKAPPVAPPELAEEAEVQPRGSTRPEVAVVAEQDVAKPLEPDVRLGAQQGDDADARLRCAEWVEEQRARTDRTSPRSDSPFWSDDPADDEPALTVPCPAALASLVTVLGGTIAAAAGARKRRRARKHLREPQQRPADALQTQQCEIEATLRKAVTTEAELMAAERELRRGGWLLHHCRLCATALNGTPGGVVQSLLQRLSCCTSDFTRMAGTTGLPMHQAKVLDRGDRLKEAGLFSDRVEAQLESQGCVVAEAADVLERLRLLVRIKFEDESDVRMLASFLTQAVQFFDAIAPAASVCGLWPAWRKVQAGEQLPSGPDPPGPPAAPVGEDEPVAPAHKDPLHLLKRRMSRRRLAPLPSSVTAAAASAPVLVSPEAVVQPKATKPLPVIMQPTALPAQTDAPAATFPPRPLRRLPSAPAVKTNAPASVAAAAAATAPPVKRTLSAPMLARRQPRLQSLPAVTKEEEEPCAVWESGLRSGSRGQPNNRPPPLRAGAGMTAGLARQPRVGAGPAAAARMPGRPQPVAAP